MAKQQYRNKLYLNNSGFLLTIYDNYCTMCREKREHIEIHHNDRNAENHNIFNLVPLCPKCHWFIHKTSIKFENVKGNHISKLYKYIRKTFE